MATTEELPLFITEEEYLQGEQLSNIKHEYIDGDVYAMSGAKVAHNQISGNVFGDIRNHLKGNPCRPFTSDMKVKVDSKYFYPDVLVDCSDLDDGDLFTETPTIIVEVLSKSTRKRDKTFKLANYMKIPTLQEYIMIEQDFVEITVIRKSQDWAVRYYYLGDDIQLDSIGLTLTVEDIYDRVKNTDMLEWIEQKAQAESDNHALEQNKNPQEK